VETCLYECSASAGYDAAVRVYVQDFTNHTLLGFGGDGKHLFTAGTPGHAGNGTAPILEFASIADAAVSPGYAAPDGTVTPTAIYASDGDGGTANRVLRMTVRPDHTGVDVSWSTHAIFHNPHSIAFHARSGLLLVADREGYAIRMLTAAAGDDLGAWTQCNWRFGERGVPFGLRFHSTATGRELLFVGSYNNTAREGGPQQIDVVDVSGLDYSLGVRSSCAILQTITLDPAAYSGPHLLGVDHNTGDLYAALVADAPQSTVLRYRCTGCH